MSAVLTESEEKLRYLMDNATARERDAYERLRVSQHAYEVALKEVAILRLVAETIPAIRFEVAFPELARK